MWLLKNSRELFEHLKSSNFNHITSIITFDASAPYTTIPHEKLKKTDSKVITRDSCMVHNGNGRYKYLVLDHEYAYFVKEDWLQKQESWHHQDAWVPGRKKIVFFSGTVIAIPNGTNRSLF